MNRSQVFLLLLIGLLALLTFVVVLPFVQYVVAAVILAYVLYPLHERLSRRIGTVLSSLVVIGAAIVAVILPLAFVMVVFVRDLTAIARGESPLDIAAVEARLFELTGNEVDVREILTTGAQQIVDVLFGGLGGIVSGTLKASLGVALTLFLLYYLLLEGPAFVAWVEDLIPLPDRVIDQLFSKLDATTWGVVVGHIAVAIAQAIIAGVGLWLTGIPDPVFWTIVMAVLALLPIIGAFLVWGPAAAYLVVVDQATAGVLLALYGLTVVSLFDNYARPIVIDQQAHVNPGVLLVGVVGGIYSIGFTGLFIGPIFIGVLAATLETFRTEYDSM
ncbi:MAG: AI-2E family transporter [Haloferacaceae archaeon]